MELNYDILIQVVQLLAKWHRLGDVSRMTRTCKFLHMNYVSLLLTPRPISLCCEEWIESFCRFMLSDPHRRFPLLSQCPSLLFSAAHALSEPVADVLTEFLGHIATLRLQCLCLHRFEDFIFSSPRVLSAFVALTGVQHLDIDTCGIVGKFSYVKLLKNMRSPLKAIKMSLPVGPGGERRPMGSYNRNLDPLWLFSAFSSTLESIFLVGRFTVQESSRIHVFPRLTHLTIYQYCMPVVRQYIAAFPSLRVLHFDYTLRPWGTSSAPPTHSLSEETLRGKTAEQIRWHNREDQLVRGSWPALEHFRAVTPDAYIAGLTCHVATLHLIAWGGTLDGEVSAICAIFADARPSVFRLSLRPAHVDYVAALFSERVQHFASLPSLALRLDVTDLPFDLASYLDHVGTALQNLPIVSLQVEVKCVSQLGPEPDPLRWPPLPECDSPRKPDSYCYVLDALSGEDMEARLRYFLEKIPTLRRATIAWGRCFLTTPHRVVTVDLDNVPHTIDRPGLPTDTFWEDHY